MLGAFGDEGFMLGQVQNSISAKAARSKAAVYKFSSADGHGQRALAGLQPGAL